MWVVLLGFCCFWVLCIICRFRLVIFIEVCSFIVIVGGVVCRVCIILVVSILCIMVGMFIVIVWWMVCLVMVLSVCLVDCMFICGNIEWSVNVVLLVMLVYGKFLVFCVMVLVIEC